MCLAAALANLRVLKEDDLVGNSRRMGAVMGELMEELKAEHPSVGDVRNIGLFGALELVRDRASKEPLAPFVGPSPEMARLGAFLKEKGVYAFIWRNLLHTNPPLCVTEAELREVFAIINEGLALTDEAVAR
jgi:taurine--2-oxoglutarate transaminase